MLAYILALAVGLGSLALYLGAFLTPELHRKNDFIWSGVGLFYALVLWVCAQRITGGVLLGQIASVALLGWFAWQTVLLRQQLLPPERQTAVFNLDALQQNLGQLSSGETSEKVTRLFGTVAEQLKTLVARVTTQKPQLSKPPKPKVAQPQSPAPQSPPTMEDEMTEQGATSEEDVTAEPSVGTSADGLTSLSSGDATPLDEDTTPLAETELSTKTSPAPSETSLLSQARDLVGTVQKQAKEIWSLFFKPKKSRPMIELHRPAPVEAQPDGDALLEDEDSAELAAAESGSIESVGGEDSVDGVAAAAASSDISSTVDPDADDWFEDHITASVEAVEPSTAASPLVEPTIASVELVESAGEADATETMAEGMADVAIHVSDAATDESVAVPSIDSIEAGEANQDSDDGATDLATEPQPDNRES